MLGTTFILNRIHGEVERPENEVAHKF